METLALILLLSWSFVVVILFIVGSKKIYKHFNKMKNRSHLKLIQGGKKEHGPYSNTHDNKENN